jgi:hypothetical protein
VPNRMAPSPVEPRRRARSGEQRRPGRLGKNACSAGPRGSEREGEAAVSWTCFTVDQEEEGVGRRDPPWTDPVVHWTDG